MGVANERTAGDMVKVGLWWSEGKPETWLRIDKGDEVEPKEKLRTNCDGEAVVDAREGRAALRSNGVLERALKSDAMSVCVSRLVLLNGAKCTSEKARKGKCP